jgi:hypothetical protein
LPVPIGVPDHGLNNVYEGHNEGDNVSPTVIPITVQ